MLPKQYLSKLDASSISDMTAFLKPNRWLRGIVAGDSLRRLVITVLARQMQDKLCAAVFAHNVRLSDRCGTDSAVHILQHLRDEHPHIILSSIDGI